MAKGLDWLTAQAMGHPLQVSQRRREPFSTFFVSSDIPCNGMCFISAYIKTQWTRITQGFPYSWFQWLEKSSLFIYLEQMTEQSVESSTKMMIIICNFPVLFITVFIEVISFVRQFHALLIPNVSSCIFKCTILAEISTKSFTVPKF